MEPLKTRSHAVGSSGVGLEHGEIPDWRAVLQSVVENTSAVVFLKDPEGRYLLVNRRFEEFFQLNSDEIIGRTDRELFASEVATEFRDNDLKVLAAGRALEFEEAVPGPEGPRVSVVTRFPVTVTGHASGSVGGIASDISELKRSERLLEAEKRLLQLIARGAPLSGVLEGICEMVEDQAPEVLGSVLQLEPDTGRLRHGAAPSLPDAYNRAVDGIEIGPSVGSCGTAAFRKQSVVVTDIATDSLWSDFREIPLGHGLRACWSMPIFSTTGSVLGTIALYAREIHEPTRDEMRLIDRAAALAGIAMERHRSEEALRRAAADRLKQEAELARTDSLTGVRNRRAFEEQGEQHFSLAVRHSLPLVLALLDLDCFKDVNDTLGHTEGDRVLREVGEVLSRAIRTSDVVARIGGDEFALVLLGVNEAGARTFFGRVLQQLDDRMRAGNWPITFSIGIAVYSGRPPARDVAVGHADELLYFAKRNGGNRLAIRECC